jgi:hypothetical protein
VPIAFGLRPASELRQAVSCSTTIRNTSASASNDARKDLFMGKTFFPKNDSAPQPSSLRGFFHVRGSHQLARPRLLPFDFSEGHMFQEASASVGTFFINSTNQTSGGSLPFWAAAYAAIVLVLAYYVMGV